MTNWKEYRFGDIAEIVMGQSPKGETCNESGIGFPLLNGPTEFTAFYPLPTQYTTDPKRFSETNDLLFCVRGSTTGKMNWSDQKYAIGRGIGAIRHRNGAKLNHFVKGIIEYHLPTLLQSATGSTFPNVSREQLNGLKIKAPDLPTQTAIAEILSSLDDKIELNNKINQELENLAQTLFKQWFIDFEFPNENGEPYKSSGGEMVDSELGEIPKGWEVIPISDVFDFLSGYPFKGESFSKSGNYGIVTIKNVQDGKFVQDTDNFIDDLPNKFPKNAILNIGDILMSLTGNVGRVCFVTKENCVLNQRVVKFKGKQENSNAFWYYFFRQTLVKELLISISKGTAQLNLSPIETKSLKFVLPKLINENLLAAFTEIFNFEVACSIENIELTNLRDTLLPKLISGELEVSQIQTAS
jgi:type I restriction enzyme S subunit